MSGGSWPCGDPTCDREDCQPARPVGGDTREALREELAEAYARWAEAPFEPADWQRENGRQVAAAVLALPAVRAALDAQETVRRVEALLRQAEHPSVPPANPSGAEVYAALRCALAGDW